MNELLRNVGAARLVAIVILSLFCLGTLYALYDYLFPEFEKAERQAAALQRENRQLRADIEDIPRLLAEYQDNQRRYEGLVARGFTNDQDRVVARKTLDIRRQRAGVEEMRFTVSPLDTIAAPQLAERERELVKSRVNISSSSMLDIPLLGFQEGVLKTFPGVPVLRRYDIGRAEILDAEFLDRISMAEDNQSLLMDGEIEFDWYTVVPVDAIRPDGEEVYR